MGGKFKSFVILFGFLVLGLGTRVALKALEKGRVEALAQQIQNHLVCDSAEDKLECAFHQYLSVAHYFANPLVGQELLTHVLKAEIKNSKWNVNLLKDEYYILVSDLYIRSLRKKRESFVGFLISKNVANLDLQMAVTFYQAMMDYSHRRELERTIASAEIPSKTSSLNSSLNQLASLIREFH